MSDIERLRALAEAAGGCGMVLDCTDPNHEWYGPGELEARLEGGLRTYEAAQFVAAVKPGVVLGLLDRIAELEGQLDRTEQQIHERGGFIDQVVDGEAALSLARRDAQEAAGADLSDSEPQSGRGCERCGGPSRYDLCQECSEHLAVTPMTDQELRLLGDAGRRPSGPDGLLHVTDDEWQAGLHAGAIETAKVRAETKARRAAWDAREKTADDGAQG